MKLPFRCLYVVLYPGLIPVLAMANENEQYLGSTSDVISTKNLKNSKEVITDEVWQKFNDTMKGELFDGLPKSSLKKCLDEFNVPYSKRTNWQLIVSDIKSTKPQTSPLCTAQLFCAFDNCDPDPKGAQAPVSELLQLALSTSNLYNGVLNSKPKFSTH